MQGEDGRPDDEAGDIAADIAQLRRLSEELAGKIRVIGEGSLANPEFIRGSLVNIYESHAILAAGIGAVFETLEANGIEIVLPEEQPGADRPPRPYLRLVDPLTPEPQG